MIYDQSTHLVPVKLFLCPWFLLDFGLFKWQEVSKEPIFKTLNRYQR